MKKNSLISLRFSLMRETDTKKNLSNFAKFCSVSVSLVGKTLKVLRKFPRFSFMRETDTKKVKQFCKNVWCVSFSLEKKNLRVLRENFSDFLS